MILRRKETNLTVSSLRNTKCTRLVCEFQEVPNNLILSLSQDCNLDAFAYGAGCWVYGC